MKQIEGIPVAMILGPLISYIYSIDRAAGNWVTLGMGLFDFATSLDPISFISALVNTVMGEFDIQAQHKIDNQDPMQFKGSRIGYVRKDGMWRRAIVFAVNKHDEFGTRNRELTMEYAGDDSELIFIMDGEGNITPSFTHGKKQDFNVNEQEMVTDFSKEFHDENDFLRGWYFLSPEEQTKVLTGVGAGTDDGFEDFKVDVASMSAYEQVISDWQDSLDIMDKYRKTPIAKATGNDIDYYRDYPEIRAMRDYQQNKFSYINRTRFSDDDQTKEHNI